MSTNPSAIALGQIFELCTKHPDALRLLVSNPATLDILSRHPEESLTALNRLGGVLGPPIPEIPYGLSYMGTADMLNRVSSLSALDISYKPCDTLYAQSVVHRTLGGRLRNLRVACPSEQAQETGCDTLLCMRGPHQPYMPDSAGALGILLSPISHHEDVTTFENVFVSQTKDYGSGHLHADDWVYAGRYELKESRCLDVDEVDALPEETFEHWAECITHRNGNSDQLAPLRARVYLSVIDEREDVTEADVTRCIAEHGDEVIQTAIRTSDIKDALRDGTIVLRAWTMRPVGYDVGIPLLLKQTRKNLEAEQQAEDAIEIIAGPPPRGTKRKAPASSNGYARPGPSTSSSQRVLRPKRRTVNAEVDCRESDSEWDIEPVRSAGPSGSQRRRA